MDAEPFVILARGPWPRDRVTVSVAPPYAVPAAREALVARAWRAAEDEARALGKRLFPGPLLGLTAFEATRERLALALHATDYRAFVGTNLSPEFRATGERRADALGVSIVIEIDEGVLLHRRGSGCFEWPLAIDTPGGHVEPRAGSPLVAALEELESELGIGAADVTDLTILGIARIHETGKPQVVVRAKIPLDVAEIARRLEGASERFETSELLPTPRGELAALAGSKQRVTPAGRAALVLASELL